MNTIPRQKLICFLYARKSQENEDRQIQSIDDQISRLKEVANTLGVEIKEILTEAKTAKKPYCRPVFADMLKRIEKGEANGILCWQFNRLSRNPIDSGALIWMLQQGIIQCIQTFEKPYYPEDNVLLLNIESGIANQFIIDLRKNCMRGMEGKAERGWKPAMAPIGYVNDRLEKIIKPDPERFTLVRQMWDMMLTGNYTPMQILTTANEQLGFRTLKHKTRGGIELSVSAIYKLFDNIFYTGMFRWKGQLYPGNHQSMITIAEYDKVQGLLGKSNTKRPQQHDFAYTGFIRCAMCGSMITASEKLKLVKTTGQKKLYAYYHCTRKNKKIPCSNPPIPAGALEMQIWKELETYTVAPEFLEWSIEYLDNEKSKLANDVDSTRTMQQASIVEAEKELGNLTKMRYREMIDDADFIKERTILKDKITKLTAQINEHANNPEKWIELTKRAFHFATYARQHFEFGSVKDRKEIFSCLGSNYRLNERKLLFKASVWLVPIKNAYADLLAEYRQLELQKHLDTEAWNTLLAPIILQWCTIVEDVRTAIEELNDPGLYIPDLKDSIAEPVKTENI